MKTESVIRSARRRLDVVYDENVCTIKSAEVSDFDCIHLTEQEVRRLQKALSKFIDLRDMLRKEL